jgi:hypothetical protein
MTTWMAAGAIAVIGITLFTLGTLLWVRLSGYCRAQARGCGSGSELTSAHFHPMARLLADEDLDFLRQFEKCRPGIVTRWDRDRRRIFRLYLREAAADFQEMHAEARRLAANAPEHEADLVGLLLRQQVTFWRTMTVIELRLTFSSLGFGKLDGSSIASLLESMRVEVNRALAPASA